MKCAFCNNEFNDNEVEGTPFVDHYCIDCHKLNIEHSKMAIKNIKAVSTTRQKHHSVTKEQYDKALNDLLNYNVA